MLISHAFRPMVELERELSALYAAWADRFWSDKEAGALFLRMSNEERAHANLIEYQHRIFQKNRQFETRVEVDLVAIEGVVAEIRKLRAAPPASVAQAVTLALRMEATAAESHYRSALRQANEEVEQLLDKLSREDGAHQAALREFATKRGIPLPD